VATGFGGVTFMIVSSLFVGVTVVLEAGPVYILFMADVRNVPVTPLQWAYILSSFAGVLAAAALAVHRPMKMAERALRIYG
jgi:ABC-2 type transport system permease protein